MATINMGVVGDLIINNIALTQTIFHAQSEILSVLTNQDVEKVKENLFKDYQSNLENYKTQIKKYKKFNTDLDDLLKA